MFGQFYTYVPYLQLIGSWISPTAGVNKRRKETSLAAPPASYTSFPALSLTPRYEGVWKTEGVAPLILRINITQK